MPHDYSQQIQTGIAKLNKYFGGSQWVKSIDLDRLDMNSLGDCVFGQLFPTYDSRPKEGWTFEKEYGFDIDCYNYDLTYGTPDFYAEHKSLGDQWKAALSQISL